VKWAFIKDIHAIAKGRGEGYLEACFARGKLSDDKTKIFFDDDVHADLRKQFAPNMPSLGSMARRLSGTAAKTITSAVSGKRILVSKDEQARRMAICDSCEFFNKQNKRCSKCGCFSKWKSKLDSEHCPLPEPKW
jgi:hypothetical protein